jgi:hypothetical protein
VSQIQRRECTEANKDDFTLPEEKPCSKGAGKRALKNERHCKDPIRRLGGRSEPPAALREKIGDTVNADHVNWSA